MKHTPTVGEHLYTHTPGTGYYYISLVRNPWTVISVKGNTCVIQSAECIFDGPQYYNSLPVGFREDPYGRTMTLRWSEKKQRWQESPLRGGCPRVAVFGEWDYYPYLD